MQTKKIITGSGWGAEEWMGIIVFIIGIAAITSGVAVWVKDGIKMGVIYLIGGIIACVLPFALVIPAMMKGKQKYECPEASKEELSKGDTVQVILLTLTIVCMFIGLGVALASAFLSWKYGWNFAERFFSWGLLGAGIPFLLFVIIVSVFIKG